MEIALVEIDDVKTGRGGKTKGEKYGKYVKVLNEKRIAEWTKEQISKSDEGIIRVKAIELGKEMGGEFINKNPTSLYWGVKYCLFNDGIVVDTGTHKSGDKLLIMRLATSEDRLPPSLARYLKQLNRNDAIGC